MLRELSVQNLALIADVRVELQPGFCAWTGETGAGKSLLLGALGLLLGERGSGNRPLNGSSPPVVKGVVQPVVPASLGKLAMESGDRRANRLDLARWIASKDNPLTFHNDWSTHWANELEFGVEK